MKKSLWTWGLLTAAVVATLAAPTARAKDQKDSNAQAAPTNLVWPLPPDKPRLKFLEMFSNNFDIEPRKKRSFVDRMVGNADPNQADYFLRPAGVAADSKGRIFVVSAQKATVFILDKEKRQVLRLRGERGIFFKTPLGVAVDSKDNFFVSDPFLRMVVRFGPTGHITGSIGSDTGMMNPTFLALDEVRRRLYVVDSKLHQVLVYNLDTLQLEQKVGKRGEKNGEFNFPVGIAVGPDGTFAVTDTGSCSVQLFTPEYKFVRRFGQQGPRPGDFVRPKGVAIDREGHIWVVDAAFSNFQIFDATGHVLMFVGNAGSQPGDFNLPMGIFIDGHDKVYVSDGMNHRVQVFQFLGGN
jgi:DNA-binding beta-propeller fold protein YncE